MGEFVIKGSGALEPVQLVTSNDASKLKVGDVQYSCLPNDKGGIVDDLLVYHLQENSYMLVVNASNIEKDWNWITKHKTFNVEMNNISDRAGLLAIQGPNAIKVLQKLTEDDLSAIPYYKFARGVFGGVKNVLMSNTGYTGAGGFEIYFDTADAGDLWYKIFDAAAAGTGRTWRFHAAGGCAHGAAQRAALVAMMKRSRRAGAGKCAGFGPQIGGMRCGTRCPDGRAPAVVPAGISRTLRS